MLQTQGPWMKEKKKDKTKRYSNLTWYYSETNGEAESVSPVLYMAEEVVVQSLRAAAIHQVAEVYVLCLHFLILFLWEIIEIEKKTFYYINQMEQLGTCLFGRIF